MLISQAPVVINADKMSTIRIIYSEKIASYTGIEMQPNAQIQIGGLLKHIVMSPNF